MPNTYIPASTVIVDHDVITPGRVATVFNTLFMLIEDTIAYQDEFTSDTGDFAPMLRLNVKGFVRMKDPQGRKVILAPSGQKGLKDVFFTADSDPETDTVCCRITHTDSRQVMPYSSQECNDELRALVSAFNMHQAKRLLSSLG